MERALEEILKYGGVLGPLFVLALFVIGVLYKDNKRLEKEKFELAVDVKDNVTLTIKSINDTMKAILIAVEKDNEKPKEYVQNTTTLKN